MHTRREFCTRLTRATAGVFVATCGLAHATERLQTARPARRREIRVGGKRVRTIDVHAHCSVPEAQALMGSRGGGGGAGRDLLISPERFDAMDSQGIDVEALSINPFWYGADRDVARRIIDIQNPALAEIVGAHPDRFVAFASVALQFPELAAAQLEEGVRRLGLCGAAIGGHVNSDELSSPKFDVFWAKAQELDAAIFIHPQGIPEVQGRVKGNGVLNNVIGNPLETTIALSHLIFDGTLDRFPGLKLCAAHGGGYLPSYADRSDHGCLVFPEQCKQVELKKRPTEYLKQIFVDSLVFTPEALRHLVATCGPRQIVLGTDYPFPWTTTSVEHVMATPGLTDADRIAILGGTAARLLHLKS